MRCIDCEYNKNCSVQDSKSRELKDGECKCECCKKIFSLEDNTRIFPRANNLKSGLCFDCY